MPALATGVEGSAGLVFVPFPRPAPARTISLAWRRTSPRGAEFRLLGEVLRYSQPSKRP